MSGHIGRKRRWPWVILSFVFTAALGWSFAVTGDGGVILRIGSAVGLGISLLFLLLASSSRRRRRAQEGDGGRTQGDEGAEFEAEGGPSGEQPPTETYGPTYEEVFGPHAELDTESLPLSPEEQGWLEDEAADIEAEEQASAEQLPDAPGPTAEEDVQAVPAELEEGADQIEALDADGDSQENLRRMREEFKARAEEAALRIKQRAELHEAASGADTER